MITPELAAVVLGHPATGRYYDPTRCQYVIVIADRRGGQPQVAATIDARLPPEAVKRCEARVWQQVLGIRHDMEMIFDDREERAHEALVVASSPR